MVSHARKLTTNSHQELLLDIDKPHITLCVHLGWLVHLLLSKRMHLIPRCAQKPVPVVSLSNFYSFLTIHVDMTPSIHEYSFVTLTSY